MKKSIAFMCVLLLLTAAISSLFQFLSVNHESAMAAAPTESAAAQPADSAKPGSPTIRWQAPDQEAAKAKAQEPVPFVDTVVDECLLCRCFYTE